MAALVNRSLTTVRTELEFLYDSEVIDKPLFDALVAAIPQKYAKDSAPWGIDRLTVDSANSVATKLATTTINEKTDYHSPQRAHKTTAPLETPKTDEKLPADKPVKPVGYCKASYAYDAQQEGDLNIGKDDFIAVAEHLSPDWWKGYKRGDSPDTAGVFPSNYVTVISETEFFARDAEKSRPPAYQSAPPQQGYSGQPQGYAGQIQQGYLVQPQSGFQPGFQGGYQPVQPSYGGYAQYPPPLVGYYPPQQQQQQQLAPPQEDQLQQHSGSAHLKKFGSKLGNAAIFGAGATIGSDIVNLIF